jgi:hypothetical protein
MGDYVYLLFGLFVIVPLLVLWVWIVFDAFARPDLKLSMKALWAAIVLLFPLVGGIAYLIFRARAKPVVQDVEGYYEPIRTSHTDAPGPPLY